MIKHGHTRSGGWCSKTYAAWNEMRARCTNPKHQQWVRYGGRGIAVTKRWDKFENFLADMGEAPADLSLDRRNNNKGYSKHNCRWATHQEQQRNLRTNVNLRLGNKKQCMAAWTAELGFSGNTIRARLNRGWSVKKALTSPLQVTR